MLFAVLCSPATGATSTLTVVFCANGTWPRSPKVIVRYDAYEDTGGHQSASVALLDAARTGVVVTAIQGRDYARIYMKELDHGRASVALSPEEQEAVERAMGR